jgi:hypothetical protein
MKPSGIPELPSQLSSDGRELWAWAESAAAAMNRQIERSRLVNEIARIGKHCDDCDKWMKSSQCPAERNENGRRRGPSMNGWKVRCVRRDGLRNGTPGNAPRATGRHWSRASHRPGGAPCRIRTVSTVGIRCRVTQ